MAGSTNSFRLITEEWMSRFALLSSVAALAFAMQVPAQFAEWQRFGYGGGNSGQPIAAYEQFDTSLPPDFQPGDGWRLQPAAAACVLQMATTSLASPGNVPPTPFGDDEVKVFDIPPSITNGRYDEIYVDSNGRIGFQPFNSDWTESVDEFLKGETMIAPLWGDYSPNNSGDIYVGMDASGAEFNVTWMNVPNFGMTNANTFQVSFSVQGGGVEVRYGPLSTFNGIAGFSQGRDLQSDPGPTDLTGFSPIGIATYLLWLDSKDGGRPIIGQTFTMELGGYEQLASVGQFGAYLLGFNSLQNPVDLGPFGATGCFSYINAVITGPLTFMQGPELQFNIQIPQGPWAGLPLFAQAAAFGVPSIQPAGFGTTNAGLMVLDVQ